MAQPDDEVTTQVEGAVQASRRDTVNLMIKTKFTLAVALLGVLVATTVFGTEADYVLINGKVYTVNTKQPWAEAVAVQGNKLVFVGSVF